ncbi:hypothetical protein K504DRAFT_462672 [Pleomassaria siparia CBS 279.74]|uniref:Uncharacterized protein n=1 Tax=Pleomassaria siparia CBS 279.74 TaxID=1314801 RepID=A0A6G1KNN8_9PLEO|nr:hypothetical protein K504DRAFT_462672 [Pleomassaria siparia CBS 279.74]
MQHGAGGQKERASRGILTPIQKTPPSVSYIHDLASHVHAVQCAGPSKAPLPRSLCPFADCSSRQMKPSKDPATLVVTVRPLYITQIEMLINLKLARRDQGRADGVCNITQFTVGGRENALHARPSYNGCPAVPLSSEQKAPPEPMNCMILCIPSSIAHHSSAAPANWPCTCCQAARSDGAEQHCRKEELKAGMLKISITHHTPLASVSLSQSGPAHGERVSV